MKLTISTISLLATAGAVPHGHSVKRADTCGQYDTVTAGGFTIYNNLWGQDSGSGSGCIGVDSTSDPIAWHSTWSWSGGDGQVKSYPNAMPSNYTPTQLSGLSSIQSTWDWTYTGTDLVADVAYDIFTGSSSSGAEFEIMIWLAALGGAGPISESGSAVDTPTINGVTWDLYTGTNGDTTVYSFVASDEQGSFSADLMDFFDYLVSSQGFSTDQYVQSVGAGTEPFTGSDAVFTTSAYSLTIG